MILLPWVMRIQRNRSRMKNWSLKISKVRKSKKMMRNIWKKTRKLRVMRTWKIFKRSLRVRKMKMESLKVMKWRVISKKRGKARKEKEKGSMMMQSLRVRMLRAEKKEINSQ